MGNTHPIRKEGKRRKTGICDPIVCFFYFLICLTKVLLLSKACPSLWFAWNVLSLACPENSCADFCIARTAKSCTKLNNHFQHRNIFPRSTRPKLFLAVDELPFHFGFLSLLKSLSKTGWNVSIEAEKQNLPRSARKSVYASFSARVPEKSTRNSEASLSVGVLNATLDLDTVLLVGVGSEVLSAVVSLHVGGGCWLAWPHLEQNHSEIKIIEFNLNLLTVNCLGSMLV